MARSKAENLHEALADVIDTLVHLGLMPYRELATPEELKAAFAAWIASSLMPPNRRTIVRKMMRSNVSKIIAGKNSIR